jgi:hypothetical protein
LRNVNENVGEVPAFSAALPAHAEGELVSTVEESVAPLNLMVLKLWDVFAPSYTVQSKLRLVTFVFFPLALLRLIWTRGRLPPVVFWTNPDGNVNLEQSGVGVWVGVDEVVGVGDGVKVVVGVKV